MTQLDSDLEQIRLAMLHVPTAEEQIEMRLDYIIRELDEMCALASNAETVDLIEKNKIAVGQVLTRAQLIASFLMERQPQPTLVWRK